MTRPPAGMQMRTTTRTMPVQVTRMLMKLAQAILRRVRAIRPAGDLANLT